MSEKLTLEDLKNHCIKTIEACEQFRKLPNVVITDDRRYQEHKMILELIDEHEQRQSTDAISREAARNLFKSLDRWNINKDEKKDVGLLYDDVMFGLCNLPTVTPGTEKEIDLDGLKQDMKALSCGYPYGLDYLLDCIKKRLGITIGQT